MSEGVPPAGPRHQDRGPERPDPPSTGGGFGPGAGLAIGAGIPVAGGTNKSATHWDMVKDLRSEGRIELDGEVVQEHGEWTF